MYPNTTENRVAKLCLYFYTVIINAFLRLKNVAIQHAIKEKLTETLMDRILQDKFVRQFGWNSAIKIGEVIKDVDYYTSILEDRDNNSSFLDRNTAKAIAGDAFLFCFF